MSHSILDSIKKKLGLGADYDVFDQDIMTHINTVFTNLNQLGIGPAAGFELEDAQTTWDAFLGPNASPLLNPVKSYIYFKVRLAFDPPSTSFHIDSMQKQIAEIEFRLLIARDELLSDSTGVLFPELPTEPVDPTNPVEPDPIHADVDGGGATV